MRLSECLNSSSVDTLRKIAESYAFDCSLSSKNALMQEILSHFNNRKFIECAYAKLQEDAYKEAVSQLMLDRRETFSREDVLAMVRRTGEGSPEDGQKQMQRMLGDGWLYCLNSKGGRQIYYIPDDLRRTMRDHLADSLKRRVRIAESAPIVYRDENMALQRDLALFLNFVSKNDIRITKDGTILKRVQQQILALFEIKEEPLGKVAWRFGYGRRFHDYPDRFALIYDYCFSSGLIEETGEGELLATPAAAEWLLQPEKARAADLFRYWRLLYRRPIPQLKLCIATLAQTAKGDWVHAASMNELLTPYVGNYYYEQAELVMEQRIYQMLVHQGLLAHGQLADGTAVIKLTAFGREFLLDEAVEIEEEPAELLTERTMPLIIQPNFDLLVPLESFERIAWELEELTELIRVDTMRVHRLTKKSVLRAFDFGWTCETVLDFLREESDGLLPGNVERMIEQWAAEFGRVKLYRAIVVECGDETTAADLQSLPELKPHVRLVLTPTHFLIADAGLPLVQAQLAKLGYPSELIE
ncbi:XPB/Ssl2-like helicase family protein [Tumebacillus sp. BK434]|uniref:helicase-associated domain-containing protein n=1 Tax=Tumebacillus sp. BK434 TaxID=2512169 RepID=UPI001047E5EC|nr:helicase-associated domain-containing protein [Tumebacillus sp. BK434]TCP58948.1 XPB/Ssl2-like helicase family protein [Tumebacillus sp. BK434]